MIELFPMYIVGNAYKKLSPAYAIVNKGKKEEGEKEALGMMI